MLSAVDDTKPPRITTAIGAWSSLPGSPPAITRGTRPRPAHSAVISTGDSRSIDPRWTASSNDAFSTAKPTSDATLMMPLPKKIPDRSLVLVDRNHLQASVMVPLTTKGTDRHWITRTRANTKYTPIRRLGPGDELVEIKVSREARNKHPSLPTHFDARVIRYQRKGYRPQVLITSLVDETKYPADEIRRLYHERWEIELGLARSRPTCSSGLRPFEASLRPVSLRRCGAC
jgi:Transposase DDE domain